MDKGKGVQGEEGDFKEKRKKNTYRRGRQNHRGRYEWNPKIFTKDNDVIVGNKFGAL